MKGRKLSRRDILQGAAAWLREPCSPHLPAPKAPPPVAITPALVDAAKKEGKMILYSSMDLPVGEKLGKAFEAAYPGITVQIERSGSERVFQRLDQEFASNIHAVDVVTTSDASHILSWKKNGWLAPFVTEDIAQHFLPEYRDPDGMSATSRLYLSSIAYNTKLVKPEDAPKSYADLLDPKWAGKMVKGHPAYSGTIMTATFQLVRDLGWDYLDKLSKQRVMQVQSSTDPPKKLSLGERAVMADGNEYGIVLLKEAGQPVEPIYPTEGTPTISGPTGDLRVGAASECRAAVPGLVSHPRDPAILLRLHRAIFGPCAGGAASRPAETHRHQADEGRSGRRRENGGRNQDALCAAVQGLDSSWCGGALSAVSGRIEATLTRSSFETRRRRRSSGMTG